MQQTGTKGIQEQTWLGKKDDLQEIVQETNKWYMHQPETILENEFLGDFEIQTNHQIHSRRPDLILINQKIYQIMDFAIPADCRDERKEDERKKKKLEK